MLPQATGVTHTLTVDLSVPWKDAMRRSCTSSAPNTYLLRLATPASCVGIRRKQARTKYSTFR